MRALQLTKTLRKTRKFRILQKCCFAFVRLAVNVARLAIDLFQLRTLLRQLPFQTADFFVELVEIKAKRLVVGRHLVQLTRKLLILSPDRHVLVLQTCKFLR
jgi:hypothetical protein